MITKLTGRLVRVLDEDIRIAVGPVEYQVLIPEMVRRQIQLKAGEEVTLHLIEYFEGNQAGSRFTPRKVGFLTEAELDFFDLFCTVEKIGVKKALKALARPVAEIADAISRQDAKWLATLPGIGAATAEQIVTTLKRKVTKFAFPATGGERPSAGPSAVQGQLIEDVYQALLVLGHNPMEARTRLDGLLQSGKSFTSVEEGVKLVYSRN